MRGGAIPPRSHCLGALIGVVSALAFVIVGADGESRSSPSHIQAGSLARTSCALSAADVAWVQIGLSAWERATREFLRVSPTPLPWIILVNRSCAFHLGATRGRLPPRAMAIKNPLRFANRAVTVHATGNTPRVWLPRHDMIEAKPLAMASLYDGARIFLTLALPDLWREEAKAAADPTFDRFSLGIMVHELVHTRQLVAVGNRIDELRRSSAMPVTLDDDIIEKRFKSMPGFPEMLEQERDLLYQASEAPTEWKQRDLARQAVELAQQRRTKYFVGENERYRELEGLFLAMEGVAVWSHYRLALIEPRIVFDRNRITSWSEDEGFALFLTIDRLVPDWQPECSTAFRPTRSLYWSGPCFSHNSPQTARRVNGASILGRTEPEESTRIGRHGREAVRAHRLVTLVRALPSPTA